MTTPSTSGFEITVLGAGSFGTAMGTLFARQHPKRRVVLYDYKQERVDFINTNHKNPDYLKDTALPPNIVATTDPQVAFTAQTQYIFHAIPVQKSLEYLLQIKPHVVKNIIKPQLLPKPLVFISMSKGIHCEKLTLMSEIMKEMMEQEDGGDDEQEQQQQQQAKTNNNFSLAFLSGGSYAKEIVDEQPTGFTVASEDLDVAEDVANLVSKRDLFTISCITNDIIGVQVAGALKNVFSIGAGLVSGMGYKYNALSLYITRANQEQRRIAAACWPQSSPQTFDGFAGIGDLLLSCIGTSRNRSVGLLLAEGKKLDEIAEILHETTEGVATTRGIYRLIQERCPEMLRKCPLLMCIHDILYEGKEIRAAMAYLMSLPVTLETI